MMKNLFILIAFIILSFGCAKNMNILSVKEIIKNQDNYEEKFITVKGDLKIFEMGYISLYLPHSHDVLIDLAMEPTLLPKGPEYIVNKYYCVIVKGTFKNYSNDFLAFNMRSEYGRILVHQIELCK